MPLWRKTKGLAMCTALNVAKYIQLYCQQKNISDCSNKKLQKLLYYVQAWSCALRHNRPIFDENIEAWLHGPVVPSIYHKYKEYGFSPIPFDRHGLNMECIEPHQGLIDAVLDIYAVYDADYLEMRTHMEAPWIEARQKDDKVITHKMMGDYYRFLNAQAQS